MKSKLEKTNIIDKVAAESIGISLADELAKNNIQLPKVIEVDNNIFNKKPKGRRKSVGETCTKRINLVVKPSMFEYINYASIKANRTISNLLLVAVEEYIKNHQLDSE